MTELDEFLAGARVDDSVFELRPDYQALLLAVDGLVPGPGDHASEALLQEAESTVRQELRDCPVDRLPQIAAWRNAFQAAATDLSTHLLRLGPDIRLASRLLLPTQS